MVGKRPYVPRRGDAVWVSLTGGSKGREQYGRRPALVISASSYNRKVGLAVCCPITSKVKGYPFEVPVPQDLKISGAVLSDQVRTLGWKERKAEFICELPEKYVEEVVEKLVTLISPDLTR